MNGYTALVAVNRDYVTGSSPSIRLYLINSARPVPPRFPDVQLEDSRPLSDYNSTFISFFISVAVTITWLFILFFVSIVACRTLCQVIATITDHAQTRVTSDSVVVKCYLHQVFNLSRKRVITNRLIVIVLNYVQSGEDVFNTLELANEGPQNGCKWEWAFKLWQGVWYARDIRWRRGLTKWSRERSSCI